METTVSVMTEAEKFCLNFVKEKNMSRESRQQGRPIMDVWPLSCPITTTFKLTAGMRDEETESQGEREN